MRVIIVQVTLIYREYLSPDQRRGAASIIIYLENMWAEYSDDSRSASSLLSAANVIGLWCGGTYIYIYICVCVCVCVVMYARKEKHNNKEKNESNRVKFQPPVSTFQLPSGYVVFIVVEEPPHCTRSKVATSLRVQILPGSPL